MASPIIWPALFHPNAVSINPNPRTAVGPPSLSGFQQAVAARAGAWVINYDGIPVHNAERINTWRAIAGVVDGRSTPIILRLCLPTGQRGHGFDNSIARSQSIPHDDDATHDDGSGYDQPASDVRAQGSVLRGATRATLTKVFSSPIVAGQFFSVGTRLYVVKAIEAQTASSATVQFWPPAREQWGAGVLVETAIPRCKVRLASDREMDLTLSLGRFGSASVAFVEDPT